ncbi:hypothetical protein Mapa_001162 [Marchantia paleacea]|nr:hypothetical protein Mapa_001162 [Marchantia paleacea]
MARSYVLVICVVLVQLAMVSYAAADDNKTFTIMNHLPKDDFINIRCDCLDSDDVVTVLSDTIGECEDKEYQASTCPNGASAKGFFCKFMYYRRSGSGIKHQYTNIKVWASTGPAKTYFKLATNGVYGSTQYENVGAAANIISGWADKTNIVKHSSLGNGQSF